jgi:hypothetical protein
MLQAVKPRPGEWPRICPEDVRELMPDPDRVAEEMIDAIQSGVPEYARPLDDTYRASVRHAARYRLRQLQLLFGDALHEPDARFELEIALRAERLLGPAGDTLPRHDDARG